MGVDGEGGVAMRLSNDLKLTMVKGHSTARVLGMDVADAVMIEATAQGGLRDLRYAVTAQAMTQAGDGGGGGAGSGSSGRTAGGGGGGGGGGDIVERKVALALLVASSMANHCGIGGLTEKQLGVAMGANVFDASIVITGR